MESPSRQITKSTNLKKGIFVSDIEPGLRTEGMFCVSSKKLLETRNGAPYLAITLIDMSGEVEGRIWNDVKQFDSLFDQGDYIRIKGDAQKFRDETQLKITYLESVSAKDVDPKLFLPVTQADTDNLWADFRKYINGIKSIVFTSLLNEMFGDRKISEAFRLAPAAKRMHHAYIGGLLEHSVSVTRLADSVCALYPHLDRDLLVSAALIHDIGKIDEFTFTRAPIDYSDRGRLLGHVVLGSSIIDGFIKRLDMDASSRQLVALKHLVLSHHGQREFGAPVLPMMEEAMVLHMIDNLDAKLNYLGKLKKGIPGPNYGWTAYQNLFERHFYLKGPDMGKDGPAGKDATEDDMTRDRAGLQPSLWF